MAKKAVHPKKVKEVEHVEEKGVTERDTVEKDEKAVVPVTGPEPEHFKEKPETPIAQRIAESRKSLDQPLPPGQAFFESPEGEIIIGEADKGKVWSRTMNNGAGGWANPRR